MRQRRITCPAISATLWGGSASATVAHLRRGGYPFPGRESSRDRKSTRLNSSHGYISYAVFCLKKNTVPELEHHQAPKVSGPVAGPALVRLPDAVDLRRHHVVVLGRAAREHPLFPYSPHVRSAAASRP